jgi:hypothetical protein
MTKKTILAVCAVLIVTAAFLLSSPMKPKTLVHVITVQWKSDATPAQIEKAIKAV